MVLPSGGFRGNERRRMTDLPTGRQGFAEINGARIFYAISGVRKLVRHNEPVQITVG
jgi:hypothetical protein